MTSRSNNEGCIHIEGSIHVIVEHDHAYWNNGFVYSPVDAESCVFSIRIKVTVWPWTWPPWGSGVTCVRLKFTKMETARHCRKISGYRACYICYIAHYLHDLCTVTCYVRAEALHYELNRTAHWCWLVAAVSRCATCIVIMSVLVRHVAK